MSDVFPRRLVTAGNTSVSFEIDITAPIGNATLQLWEVSKPFSTYNFLFASENTDSITFFVQNPDDGSVIFSQDFQLPFPIESGTVRPFTLDFCRYTGKITMLLLKLLFAATLSG